MSGGTPCGCGRAACGCCEGVRALTPLPVHNRPGLGSLTVRIGTQGSFLATMKARLSSHRLEPTGTRPLARLRVRHDDGSIALLDSWACVLDVLTFYQERIVNEGYLRTATEMRSLHGLAGLVGYTPRPGVAASVFLAYTLDEKSTDEVVIPAGARSQAVPGPGELPQFFETSEDLPARAAWNRIGVRRTEPLWWSMGLIEGRPESERELYLAGTATRLQPGDPLLIAIRKDLADDPNITDDWTRPAAVRVIAVEPDIEAGRTRIRIEPWVPDPKPASSPTGVPDLGVLRRSGPRGRIADSIRELLGGLPATTTEATVPPARIAHIRDAIEAHVHRAGGLPALHLRAWADQVDQALAAMVDTDRSPPRCNMEALVKKLVVDPSRPPPSAAHLPGSVKRRFEQAGDGGLALLSQSSIDLAGQLAAGMRGCVADAEVPVRVYTLRLRGNLFGHNALKQRETVFSIDRSTDNNNVAGTFNQEQRSTTREIGEWPIVTLNPRDLRSNRREEPFQLDLDGSHDGILPGSWLFVDMTGVTPHRAKPPVVAVACSGRYAIGKVVSVQPKMSRADYGLTGPITRIRFEGPEGWIVIAEDKDLTANNRALLEQPVIDMDFECIRGAAVWAVSEELELAESPISDSVCVESVDDPIELDGLYLGLEPGRFVMVSGERADIDNTVGVIASEPAMIAAVVHDVRAAGDEVEPWSYAARRAREGPGPSLAATAISARFANVAATPSPAPGRNDNAGVAFNGAPLPTKFVGDAVHTFIWLARPLSYCYQRASLEIRANVVKATHGESQREILGNGDGSKPHQRFTLKHAPLTWLPSPTPSGAEDTLDVYVNDIRWNGVASFTDLTPTARAYAVLTDHEGVSSVMFGDGREGARLPTGGQNVVARYRTGLGKAGNVRAGQIQQLVTRPLGVKEVVNPYRASGGADPENVDQVRENAPLGTAALGRLVATRDYADFARTFAGIGKAAALEISDGHRRVVHLTIAGQDDIPIDDGSDLMRALRAALRDLGDPFQAVVVATRELLLLVIEARIAIDPDRLWDPVVTAVRAALLEAFGFGRRALGQGIAASEVVKVIQAVEGVAMVDLDLFGALPTIVADEDGPRPATPADTSLALSGLAARTAADGVSSKVDAALARPVNGILRPAQLVILSPEVAATLVLNQIVEAS